MADNDEKDKDAEKNSKKRFRLNLFNKMWGNLKEFQTPTPDTVKSVFSGDLMTKGSIKNNLLLILEVGCLCFFYVSNRYTSERELREIDDLKKSVYDAKIEALTYSSQLMEICKQSQVEKAIKQQNLGLVESSTPPFKMK